MFVANHLIHIQGRQGKRWEENIREWTGLEFGKSQRAVEKERKMEKTGCKIICGAPTTLAVKELMMIMMMIPPLYPPPRMFSGLRSYEQHTVRM